MIILDQLLPMAEALYFHSEAATPAPFHHSLSILPSTERLLPPGTAESFFAAGVRNVTVITGYDTHFVGNWASALQPALNTSAVLPIASTLLQYILSELRLNAPEAAINATYLEELVQCLAVDGTCAVMERLLGSEDGAITSQLRKAWGSLSSRWLTDQQVHQCALSRAPRGLRSRRGATLS